MISIRILLTVSFSITLSACGTFRPVNDEKSESLTGVRTMYSNSCWTGADCLEKAIQKAKEDCKYVDKTYQYSGHEITGPAILKYKCI